MPEFENPINFHSHTELEEKDDKVQQMYRTIEMRTLEAQRFKTAAEAAKVSFHLENAPSELSDSFPSFRSKIRYGRFHRRMM